MSKVRLNVDKIKELKIGEIKYRELIKILEMENKRAGNPRNAQLRELGQYINIQHVKAGNFVIHEIYSEVRKKMDNRKGNSGGANNKVEYIENIEKLILNLLAQNEENKVFLSKNQLFRELKMVNDNYSYCKRKTLKLGKFMNIDIDNVNEWFETTGGMLRRNIESALDNLRSQAMIIWSSEITVCKIKSNSIGENGKIVIKKEKIVDEYDNESEKTVIDNKVYKEYREATDQEKEYILTLEGWVLDNLGCKNKQEVIQQKKWDIFSQVINEKLLKEKQIEFYYNSYKIIYNKTRVNKKLNSLCKLELTEEEIKLNKDIIDRIKANAEKRHIKSKKECIESFGEIKDTKMNMRLHKNYIDNQCNLTNAMIDINYNDICEDIKKTKLK